MSALFMRSYCPDFFVHPYQIVSLFDMYIDMGERIAGEQDRPKSDH